MHAISLFPFLSKETCGITKKGKPAYLDVMSTPKKRNVTTLICNKLRHQTGKLTERQFLAILYQCIVFRS